MSRHPPAPSRPAVSVVLLAGALLVLACVPAAIARAALASIPGDTDGSVFNHLVFAIPAFAMAAGLAIYALRAVGGRARWSLAAGVLLPFAWLPSALSWPAFAELLLTLAVLTGGVVCVARALERRAGPARQRP